MKGLRQIAAREIIKGDDFRWAVGRKSLLTSFHGMLEIVN